MKTHSIKTFVESSPALPAPLHLVLAYDRPEMATAARALLGIFLTKWVPEIDIHRDEWTFAEMENQICRTEALELARSCDIFVISVANPAYLPDSVLAWLNEWIDSRDQKQDTAVVLLTTSRAQMQGACCPLAQAMSSAPGISFFTTSLVSSETLHPPVEVPNRQSPSIFHQSCESLPEFSGIND